jgi:hypothetical protein
MIRTSRLKEKNVAARWQGHHYGISSRSVKARPLRSDDRVGLVRRAAMHRPTR